LSVNSAGGWVKAKKQEQFNYLPHSCNADTFEYKEVAEIAIHKIMKTKRRKKRDKDNAETLRRRVFAEKNVLL